MHTFVLNMYSTNSLKWIIHSMYTLGNIDKAGFINLFIQCRNNLKQQGYGWSNEYKP